MVRYVTLRLPDLERHLSRVHLSVFRRQVEPILESDIGSTEIVTWMYQPSHHHEWTKALESIH